MLINRNLERRMSMEVKCIALDLDGTTLFDDSSITQKTKDALEDAIDSGLHIVVASGRCLDSLPRCITDIAGIQYAITSNGAAVYQIRENKCLKRFPIPSEAVEKVMSRTKRHPLAYEAFFNGKAYASGHFIDDPSPYGLSHDFIRYIKATRNRVDDIGQFICDNKDAIDSIDLIVATQGDFFEVFHELQTYIPEIYITSSVPNRIEIASKKAGKHRGLSYLLNELDIEREATAAFGNADNDIEMLSYVKFGFAVQNATPKCKEAAFQIVPSNTDDGVAFGIRQLIDMRCA